MKHKNIFIVICLVICILFAISTVNAGIFEFSEDTGDEEDSIDYDIEDDDLNIEEFTIKISKPKSVQKLISKIKDDPDYEDDYSAFNAVLWLMDFEDNVVFKTDDGDYLIVEKSESDKIPSSEKYSSCIIECKVIDENFDYEDFYLVKDIKVIKKIKKEVVSESSEITTIDSDSSSSSDYSDSSSQSSSYTDYPSYIGNSNSGKFHSASCRDVDKMNPSNKVYFYNREDAINSGYVPCGHCTP